MPDREDFSPRVAVNAAAILQDEAGKDHACTLIDLSTDGFRAKLKAATNPRDLRKLTSGTDTYDIDVRWSSGLEIGGRIL